MIERFRKKPVEVETILWDGTAERYGEICDWVGESWHGPESISNATITDSHELAIWNKEERGWIPCPVGHRVVRGLLGEFYPISPGAVAKTYEPAARLHVDEGDDMKIWSCKIGESPEEVVHWGADLPMRHAVEAAYRQVTGREPEFIFSGWGAELDEAERAVVEGREPVPSVSDVADVASRAPEETT